MQCVGVWRLAECRLLSALCCHADVHALLPSHPYRQAAEVCFFCLCQFWRFHRFHPVFLLFFVNLSVCKIFVTSNQVPPPVAHRRSALCHPPWGRWHWHAMYPLPYARVRVTRARCHRRCHVTLLTPRVCPHNARTFAMRQREMYL